MKRIGLLLTAIMLAAGLLGCARSKSAIQIKGSDTMVNLGQAWAEQFMEKYPKLLVAVTGGGSGTGIASLINGTTDIAECSRSMEKREIELANKKGIFPYEIEVAYDGIALVVSPQNPISRLTIEQLSDIFSGKITSWKDVGGPDKEIVALSRDRNSGTHIFFLEHVIKMNNKEKTRDFAKRVLMMPSNQAIVEEVASNPEAIGYIGLGYLSDKLKAVAVAKDESSAYIIPSIQTVKDKSYSISRPLYMYTNAEPSDQIKTFIDYVLSEEGQKIVLDMDFVPLK